MGPTTAKEKATKKECIAKPKEAVKLINEVGVETGIRKIGDKSGPSFWKYTYMFAFDDDKVTRLIN